MLSVRESVPRPMHKVLNLKLFSEEIPLRLRRTLFIGRFAILRANTVRLCK